MTAEVLSIQIFSDIHIELWSKLPEIPIRAKYLFLAGDICCFDHPLFFPFLDYCSTNWKKIFYVLGNHEYYNKKRNYNELNFEYKYRIKERYRNLYCLDNDFVSLDEENVNIYGSTFWTIPPFLSTNEAKIYINDYNYMSYFNKNSSQVKNLDITFVKELADESFLNLQKYLKETTNKKTIIMTHFPPHRIGTSNPKYLEQKKTTNLYFSWPNDTLEKFNLENVLVWISGHTHWSYDFYENNVRLISNQLGYKNEIGKTGLNENGLFEINVS